MKKITSIFLFLFLAQFAEAQSDYLKFKTYKPYKWMFAVGWNAVDDDGRDASHLMDYKNAWNYLPYPTELSVDRYIKYNWSMDLSLSYNIYTPNKIINDTVGLAGHFAAVNLNAKYSLLKFLYPTKWFGPYGGFGVGLTYRDTYKGFVPTANLLLGFNFWVTKNFGIRLQTRGVLAIEPDFFDSKGDYMQHSAAIVYRIMGGNKKNRFNKRKHKWTHKKKKFKGKNQ